MPIEIERKFLVTSDAWRRSATNARRFCQGYLAKTQRGSVRVRRAGGSAVITVKGRRQGIARPEYEYDVPVEHAEEMLKDLCAKPLVEKVRHDVSYDGLVWEVDVYCGAAEGLVLAEVELQTSHQLFNKPEWVGVEVTHDLRFRTDTIARGLWRDTDEHDVRRATAQAGEIREATRGEG